MTLSGTHEIVTHPWAGQASSARPSSKLTIALVSVALPVIYFGGVFTFLAIKTGWNPSDWFSILAWIVYGSIVLPSLFWLVLGRIRFRNPVVDFDAATVRIGPDVTRFEEIDRAWIIEELREPYNVYFVVAGTGHRHVRVFFRSAKGAGLSETNRQVLAQLIERSSIELPDLPVDRWDPKRKFIGPGEPDYLTKERALALLAPTAIPRP